MWGQQFSFNIENTADLISYDTIANSSLDSQLGCLKMLKNTQCIMSKLIANDFEI